MDHHDIIGQLMAEEGGPTVLFHDTFTDIGTVALEDHTPDVGGPWFVPVGAVNVVGGQAVHASGGTRGNAYIATGESDIYILSSGARYAGFVMNWVDASNFYVGSSSTLGNSHYAEVYKVKGGAFAKASVIGPVSWVDTDFAMQKHEIQIFGGVIKVKVSNPSNPADSVSAQISDSEFTSGKHGLYTIFAPNPHEDILCRTTDETDL